MPKPSRGSVAPHDLRCVQRRPGSCTTPEVASWLSNVTSQTAEYLVLRMLLTASTRYLSYTLRTASKRQQRLDHQLQKAAAARATQEAACDQYSQLRLTHFWNLVCVVDAACRKQPTK